MKINLKLYSILRDKLPAENKGKAVLNIANESIIADILEKYKINRRVVISLNGSHVTDKTRKLKDGDEIIIFSSISGG